MMIITINLKGNSTYIHDFLLVKQASNSTINEIAHSNRTGYDVLFYREQLQVLCAHHIRSTGVERRGGAHHVWG